MLPFSSAATNVKALIHLFSGALKGSPAGKVLSGPVLVRNETRLTQLNAPRFARNPALPGRRDGQAQLGAQLQRLGNLRQNSAPVLRRLAALTTPALGQHLHSLHCPPPPAEDDAPAGSHTQAAFMRPFAASERFPVDVKLAIQDTATSREREQINASAPPRVRELHPKALAHQARLQALQVHRGGDARPEAQAQAHADILAALEPTTNPDSSLVETVSPIFYNPLFARIDFIDASDGAPAETAVEPHDTFDDATALSDMEQLAAECRFLREECEIKGMDLAAQGPRLHDALLGNSPDAAPSLATEQLRTQLQAELAMYQEALEDFDRMPGAAKAAEAALVPVTAAISPAQQLKSLFNELREFNRDTLKKAPSAADDTPADRDMTTLTFRNALKSMQSVHGKDSFAPLSEGDSGVDSAGSDDEWDA